MTADPQQPGEKRADEPGETPPSPRVRGREAFGWPLLTFVATSLALGGYFARGPQISPYEPGAGGVAQYGFAIYPLVFLHYVLAPVTWAILRRGDRRKLDAGLLALAGLVGALVPVTCCVFWLLMRADGFVGLFLLLVVPPVVSYLVGARPS